MADDEKKKFAQFRSLYDLMKAQSDKKIVMDFDSLKKYVIDSYNKNPGLYQNIDPAYIQQRLEGIIRKWADETGHGRLNFDNLLDKIGNFLYIWDHELNGD